MSLFQLSGHIGLLLRYDCENKLAQCILCVCNNYNVFRVGYTTSRQVATEKLII